MKNGRMRRGLLAALLCLSGAALGVAGTGGASAQPAGSPCRSAAQPPNTSLNIFSVAAKDSLSAFGS